MSYTSSYGTLHQLAEWPTGWSEQQELTVDVGISCAPGHDRLSQCERIVLMPDCGYGKVWRASFKEYSMGSRCVHESLSLNRVGVSRWTSLAWIVLSAGALP